MGVRSTGSPSRRTSCLHAVDLQPPLVEAEHLHEGLLHAAGTTQHGVHARHQLSRAERLHEVVVGPGDEPGDALVLAGLGCEHDDGHVRAAADLLAHLFAGEVGEHEVEHDEVGLVALGERQPFAAVDGGEHVEPVLLQVGAHDLAHRLLVVDDHDLLLSHCATSASAATPGTVPRCPYTDRAKSRDRSPRARARSQARSVDRGRAGMGRRETQGEGAASAELACLMTPEMTWRSRSCQPRARTRQGRCDGKNSDAPFTTVAPSRPWIISVGSSRHGGAACLQAVGWSISPSAASASSRER